MIPDLRLVIGDTETTGIDANRKAIQIALMELDWDLNILGEEQAMFNPQCAVSPEATAVHGYTLESLQGYPTFEQWLADTYGGPLEGHFALIGFRTSFDKPMFDNMMQITHTLDLLELARRHVRVEGLKDYKLQTLREALQLEGGDAHDALGDVHTTFSLLKHLLPLSGRGLAAHLETKFVLVHRMPWGRHSGELLNQVPKGYRDWLLKEANDLDPHLRRSLEMIRDTEVNIADLLKRKIP